MKKPYRETKDASCIIREFDSATQDELEWHRDARDRTVEVVENSSWGFQLDDELPAILEVGKKYFIPKETYHRVIKGNGTLKIKIYEDGY